MSNNITIEDIFNNGGAINDFKDNYKERPAQIEAARRIKEAFDKECLAVVEGETGMGKSYAYIFPMIMNMEENKFNRKAVIVTSGISLQEQLYTKDIPFAIRVAKSVMPNFPRSFKATLLKGRQNFICKNKCNEIGMYTTPKNMMDSSYRDIYDFVNKTKTGDLSDLDFIPNSQILEHIACTKKGECVKKGCDFAEECFYNKHRANVLTSNIIITNYHMLFSDLATGGSVLPNYDMLVFDEAHEAANIFREFDAERLSIHSFNAFRNKCSEINNSVKGYEELLDADKLRVLIGKAQFAFNAIDEKNKIQSPTLITSIDQLPSSFLQLKEDMSDICGNFSFAYKKEETLLDTYLSSYGEEDDMYKAECKINKLFLITKSMLEDIVYFINSLDIIIKDENSVLWVDKINDEVSINFKQVTVGQQLNQEIFSKPGLATIFTSATMSVGGSFDYVKDQLGVSLCDKECIEYIGNSPFDLTKQQLWYLPEDAIDGNKPGFDKMIATNIVNIVEATGGGALCLFTSVKNMRNTYYELTSRLGGKYNILVQGDAPKSKLIDVFKNDKDSILLGTRSFFTGVDVPGDSLRCVIIDKFPFPQPTDPVQQKLMKKDNAFYKYSIPEMIILLKQAVGRGVRSIDDKCVVSILDGRMSTARYKNRVNNSFNYKKTGTRKLDDIYAFCSNIKSESKKEEKEEVSF